MSYAQRRKAAGNSHTRRVINSALTALGIKHDRRFNPGIPELQQAELALYGTMSKSEDALYRWNQVLIATAIRDKYKNCPLNLSRKYLKAGVAALDWGDLRAARGFFRSASMEQEKWSNRDK